MYTVAAQSVSSAGSQYDPSPGTQNVNVTSGAAASASVGYTPASAAGLNLRIDGMYLTQSVQTYDGEVPLVKDRDGFLRVFVTATQSNLAAPSVRVRFAVSGVPTKDTILGANGLSVPLSPNEGSLSASWNMPVPGALIQPNLTILAEVDPANTVAETNESDNLFPSAGTPLALEVRPTSTFAVRFVSIRQTANGLQGDVTNTNKATYLGAAMQMHPLAAYDADVRATSLSTDAPAVQASNSTAWTQILNELKAARTSDGSSRYYYGVVKPSYSSGIAGIGYVGVPVAIGWDKPGADRVAAHEWGHNWGRQHAPCGQAGNPDLNYPYANGAIGVYGFDVGARIIKPPTYSDLMGYCNNEWISDYTYTGVLDFRGTHADVESAFAQAMQPCLLVWGRIVDGQPVLEPAFQVVTRPSLPAAPGPYSVEGTAADGSSIFRVSFAPDPVADDPAAGAQFAFAVPLQPDRAERLVAMHLVERGRRIASVRASAGAAATARRGGQPAGRRPGGPPLGRVGASDAHGAGSGHGRGAVVRAGWAERDRHRSGGAGPSAFQRRPRPLHAPRRARRDDASARVDAGADRGGFGLLRGRLRPAGVARASRPDLPRTDASRLGGAHHAGAGPLLRDLSRVLGHAGRLGRGAVRGPALRGGHGNLDRQRAACANRQPGGGAHRRWVLRLRRPLRRRRARLRPVRD